MVDSRVAERYGRTDADRRRRLVFGVVAALGVLLVVVAWVVWVGLFSPSASLEARDTGYTAPGGGELTESDTSVDIRFEVTTEPGSSVSCALQALNEQFAIVGWKVVDLAPGDSITRSFVENVRVTEPAVTGLIYRCWLT
jgi:hypothetical protein